MVLEVTQRIRDIASQGDYEGTALNAHAPIQFTNQIDSIMESVSPQRPLLLLLPRPNTGWQIESGAGFYQTTLSYDMYWYVRKVADNEILANAEQELYEELISNVYLSRPQLQLNDVPIANIVGRLSLQTTNNLFVPIFYPPSGVGINQGATPYWGLVMRLTLQYRKLVKLSFS